MAAALAQAYGLNRRRLASGVSIHCAPTTPLWHECCLCLLPFKLWASARSLSASMSFVWSSSPNANNSNNAWNVNFNNGNVNNNNKTNNNHVRLVRGGE